MTYDNPVEAIFLRMLAWETIVAGKELKVKEAVTLLQLARQELGLSSLKGGAAQDFLQKLRLGNSLLSPKGESPKPTEIGWSKMPWRLLYLPAHSTVRELSFEPVITQWMDYSTHREFNISVRNPAVPKLHVHVGKNRPKGNTFGTRRGLYFLRKSEGAYIGQSDEFDTRLRFQSQKQSQSWCFVSIADNGDFLTQDALDAAESLLMSFWNEVSVITNQKRGGDKIPRFDFLQQAIILTEGISAVLLWLHREHKEFGLTLSFKEWSGQNWPECYYLKPTSP